MYFRNREWMQTFCTVPTVVSYGLAVFPSGICAPSEFYPDVQGQDCVFGGIGLLNYFVHVIFIFLSLIALLFLVEAWEGGREGFISAC